MVDDALTVRMYCRQVLEESGFEVDEAVNGYEGLEKALASSFALIIADVNMPVMDGYTFVRALREEPTLCAIPSIMISTEAEIKDINQAYAAGANLYMVKPIKPAELSLHARLLTGDVRQ